MLVSLNILFNDLDYRGRKREECEERMALIKSTCSKELAERVNVMSTEPRAILMGI